jgi:hypothetical protein
MPWIRSPFGQLVRTTGRTSESSKRTHPVRVDHRQVQHLVLAAAQPGGLEVKEERVAWARASGEQAGQFGQVPFFTFALGRLGLRFVASDAQPGPCERRPGQLTPACSAAGVGQALAAEVERQARFAQRDATSPRLHPPTHPFLDLRAQEMLQGNIVRRRAGSGPEIFRAGVM